MENALAALSEALAGTVERTAGAVAAVNGRRRHPSSGIVWEPGVIVTAEHNLHEEDEHTVTLAGGGTRQATLAGRDPATDLAVLKADTGGIAALERNGSPKPGSMVVAVGRGADVGPIAALGAVAATGGPWRTWRGGLVDSLLKLDIGVYPGMSGAAVVDAGGRLLGLATAGLSRSSVIAIPAVTMERVVRDLLATGRVRRGYLGVGLQPVAVPESIRSKTGVENTAALIVVSVEPGSPAERAGLLIGDVLVALAGRRVGDVDDVQAALGAESVGQTLEAALIRGGAVASARIEIRER
jgi:S1-C subfamily serine protease